MDLQDLAKLPVDERLQAMEILWTSLLNGTDGDLPMPAWHAEVLAERLRAFEAGNEPLVDFDVAMELIREELRRG